MEIGILFSCARCGAKFYDQFDLITYKRGHFTRREAEAAEQGWTQYEIAGARYLKSIYWLCPAHAGRPLPGSVQMR